jgi:hypothetical protein
MQLTSCQGLSLRLRSPTSMRPGAIYAVLREPAVLHNASSLMAPLFASVPSPSSNGIDLWCSKPARLAASKISDSATRRMTWHRSSTGGVSMTSAGGGASFLASKAAALWKRRGTASFTYTTSAPMMTSYPSGPPRLRTLAMSSSLPHLHRHNVKRFELTERGQCAMAEPSRRTSTIRFNIFAADDGNAMIRRTPCSLWQKIRHTSSRVKENRFYWGSTHPSARQRRIAFKETSTCVGKRKGPGQDCKRDMRVLVAKHE